MRPTIKQTIKRTVLPRGPHARRLPVGLGRGLKMQIDFATQTRTYLGLYEIELNRHFRRILRPGITAFDVGGQHGYDALVIAKHTNARVVSFECDGTCLTGMQNSLALNPRHGALVRAVKAMVGDGPGETGLDEYAYADGGFVPDFLKIDIEGGEAGALRSAHRLLAERHPSLIVEVHSRELERTCGAILVDHGYRPTIVNQRTLLPDHRPAGRGACSLNRWLVAT